MEATSDRSPDISSTSSVTSAVSSQPSAEIDPKTIPMQPGIESHDSTLISVPSQTSSNAAETTGVSMNSGQEDVTPIQENENDNCSGELDDGDNASEISDFSNFSQESWQPVQGPIAWVQEQMRLGQSPRKILEDLVPSGTMIPEGLDPIMLWKIIINIVSEPPKRKKLHDINTLDDVLHLLNSCKKIIVLTGAGVSVSCGIPDFRSRDGVYARLTKDFPNLPDPQAMFDIHFFRNDPRPFFKFAKEIYPGQFRPSLCHYFIKLLEDKGKLLRNYTQNIDTLEQVAGIQRVVQCHGSFATATCAGCGHKVDSDVIKEDIFNQVIPHCPHCSPSNHSAVMKPDIVFFGESLPEHFHNQMAADKDECDLLIVIGSSLKVRPVALIPNSLPAHVPQVLINRERLHYLNFDVELLGNCDDIVGELCRRLGSGWEQLAAPGPPLSEVILSNLPTPPVSPHSGESRDKWDDSNAAVSSSEGTLCSEVTPAFSSVSKQPKDSLEETAPSNGGHPEDDGGVQEVSTSQSEATLIKTQRGHHHRHTLKRPFSLLGSSSGIDVSADQASKFPEADQAGHNMCSPEEVETLVSACHKRDVMYVPSEKASHGHHGQISHSHSGHCSHGHHHHHHHGQSQANEPSNSHSHHHQLSATDQSSPPHLYNDECITEHSQPKPHSSSSSTSHQLPPPACQESHSPSHDSLEGKQELCSSKVAEADSQEEGPEETESCSESKRPRLSLSPDQDTEVDPQDRNDNSNGPNEDRKDASDSLSQEGSLDDIRKMWRSKRRISLAQRLADNQVLFLPPSRYVFKGAEVFSESESEDSDDDENDDDDDSSIDSEADNVPDNALESSSNSNTVESAVDSSLVTSVPSEDKNHVNPDTSPTSLHSGGGVEIASSSETAPLHHDTPNTLPGDTSEVSDIDCAQLNECSPQPSIPSAQTTSNDIQISCPVSSTDDVQSDISPERNSTSPSSQT